MRRAVTVHGSLTNKTPDRLRFSADVRFQPASDPVDPRHTVHGGEWDREAFNKAAGISDAQQPTPVSESVRRSMDEAKEEWGLVRKPVGSFALTEAEGGPADAYTQRNLSKL